MKIEDILSEELVLYDLQATTKTDVLVELASAVARQHPDRDCAPRGLSMTASAEQHGAPRRRGDSARKVPAFAASSGLARTRAASTSQSIDCNLAPLLPAGRARRLGRRALKALARISRC